MNSLKEITEQHYQAAIEKRVADILDNYVKSEELYVFVEGPRWATVGYENVAKGWADFCDSPIFLEKVEWIEGPRSEISGDMGWIGGQVELTVRIKGETKTIRFRGTFVMRLEPDGKWRVIHEHFSQPAADPYGIGDWLKTN